MIVTSIDLLNHLRCRRYSALHSKEREVEYFDIDFVTEAFSLELEGKACLQDEFPERRNALNVPIHSSRNLKNLFQKIVLPNSPSMLETPFERTFENEFQLRTKPDFIVSKGETLELIKIHASTDNHYLSMHYTLNKHKIDLFEKNEEGYYSPKVEVLSEAANTNYYEKMKRCMSRHYDTGRIVYDLAFQEFIMKSVFPSKTRKYIVGLLNHDFSLQKKETGEIEYDKSLFVLFDFTSLVMKLQDKIQADLYRMINHIELNDDSRCLLVKNECLKGEQFSCEYTDFCFSHVPENNSILSYFFSHLGFKEGTHRNDKVHETYDLLNEGMVDMLDVPISWLQREKNLMQRYCVENDYTYVNKKKIKAYLNQISYPLYFLDFESYPSPIPRFEFEKPYSQSVFQYSIHIELSSNINKLIHKEFLATDYTDQRKNLVKQLLDDIPVGNSKIVVYNMSFEQQRLQEFKTFFPEYAERLDEIQSRLFDLMKLLKNDLRYFADLGYSKEEAETYNFYHPMQNGSYSIKKILKAFGIDSYEKMRVQNGIMAYKMYLELGHLKNAELKEAIFDLKTYCWQDTYSMVVILDKIQRLIR
ncbi:MAG: DUF2779 domain-containing protein [Candidatus Izemoplasmatales bacterium]|jgi:hypothetical protein|nr:DUF2779 domain-containing protein [Candidatus Izemoplasmatales bacterium]